MIGTNRVPTYASFVVSPLTVHKSTTKDIGDVKPQDYLTMQALNTFFGGNSKETAVTLKSFIKIKHSSHVFLSNVYCRINLKFATLYIFENVPGMFSGMLVHIYSVFLMASPDKSFVYGYLVLSQVS